MDNRMWDSYRYVLLAIALIAICGVVGWMIGAGHLLEKPSEHKVVGVTVSSDCRSAEWANVTEDPHNPQLVTVSGQYFTRANGQLGISHVDLQETKFNTLMVIVSTGPRTGSVIINQSRCLSPPGVPPTDWANQYNATIRTNADEIRVYHDGREATVKRFSEEQN